MLPGAPPADTNKAKPRNGQPAQPSLSPPKGGGAVRGIGEKFAANPMTGTASMSVPIATSPGRAGFGPQLALSYDSGAGNGPFGIGWSLSIPAITRKTDKGIPQYQDGDTEESDVFLLSGAEDLVPAYKRQLDGSLSQDHDVTARDGYSVKRYRPRVEGLFARIERWTRVSDGETHWRSISKDNILSVYGRTSQERIADPANASRVFSWLLSESYDDKGNAIVYDYCAENDDNVDFSQVNERNRVRSANRYLKTIRYGNARPLLLDPSAASFRRSPVPPPDFQRVDWNFEVVFDYGEGHYQESPPNAEGRIFATARPQAPLGAKRPARLDPFSSYRSGFELRSYRLCRRVLMFHHFPDELETTDYLVRSTEFSYREQPNGSFIAEVLQSGFKRIGAPSGGSYLKRSLPPLEFEYSVSPLAELTQDQLPLQEVTQQDLENLPAGIDGTSYRWVDLDGEGISGVLSEQGDAWFYKRNLGEGQLGPIECVARRPSLAALSAGSQQLLDLTGDGNLDLVELGPPMPGFFPRSETATWDDFRAFRELPNLDWQDPNLRFVDLTGDGHADLLVTDDLVFATWYESKAEDGFGSARRVALAGDQAEGPLLVFADATQSLYLADMSGDGLSDLVRIRASEVCYWPNLGYGRFGAQVTMDNAPCFDDPTSFDQRRVRLTDTDGSGPTDIVYLGRDGVRIYLNQHGNRLSDARLIRRLPPADDLTSVSVVDFLGRGTACLLWSSPLPADAQRALRYLDLMGGVKPHLLTTVRNNLGVETRIEYASSTSFYLADRKQGTPWVTRLPFPVHVVTTVETRDLLGGNCFVSSSTYHHGYFDGIEREFLGFGRVDQRDTQEFGKFSESPPGALATNLDPAFHLPPTLTKTWFHTGAYLADVAISRHFASEYYQEGDSGPPGSALSSTEREAMLLADTVLPATLDNAETREAVRSLKGAILRQEVYGLDQKGTPGRPYSASERNYTIEVVQPRGDNRHSVFFTHEREVVDFHYERKLFPVIDNEIVDARTAASNPSTQWRADPRVTHGLTLKVDEYGNVEQSVAIAYGRRYDDVDPVLTDDDRRKQKQLLATLTEASFTEAISEGHAYRTPLPAAVDTYELVRLGASSSPSNITRLFLFDDMRKLVAAASAASRQLEYEDVNALRAIETGPYRRAIERVRTIYRSNDLLQLLPVKGLRSLALPGETYQLAFTPGLLEGVFQRPVQGGGARENLLPNPADVLSADNASTSNSGGYVDLDGDGRWWLPSGRIFYHSDRNASATTEQGEAIDHFFLPRRFRNPFGQESQVDYAHDLFPAKTRDALGNTVAALHDYRALQIKQLTDPNENRSLVAFDALGLPVATAVQGKNTETLGDSLADLDDVGTDPSLGVLQQFAANPSNLKSALLRSATSRFVYDLDRFRRCGQPPFAATLVRETHVSDLLPSQAPKIQVSFVYSDSLGRELQSKIQAEPGEAPQRAAPLQLPNGDIQPGPLLPGKPPSAATPRWVGKGRTVYNNKGRPVKQYEPFFSGTHLFESEQELTDTGVTSILFYDPVNRVVATLHPNHTYEKVRFDPWRQEIWDVNDTVTVSDPKNDPDVGEFFKPLPTSTYLPSWHDQRSGKQKGVDEQAAAASAAVHAATPSVAYFDTLGRPMLSIADNGKDASGAAQKYATRIVLDVEGNHREIRDGKDRVVMRYDYDLLGNRIHQSSMEAGERWSLNDVMGKPIRAWDSRAHLFRTEYDQLRRPLRSFVTGADPLNPAREICFERTVYGESTESGLDSVHTLQANLRGKPYRHYDTAGIITSEGHDFKGNLLRSTRQLLRDYKVTADWSLAEQPVLDNKIFGTNIRYDALDRAIQMVAPHDNKASTKINVIRPSYNEASLLERVDAWLGQAAESSSLLDPSSAPLHAVTNIDYDAKGQRARIEYGNGTLTEYTYDEQTFRLIHLKTRRSNAAGKNGSSAFQDLFYTYDPAGNITRIRDDAQQTIFFGGQVVSPQCDYTYDAIYRLIEATGREHIGQVAQPQTSWNDEFRVNLAHPNDGRAMRNYTEQYVYDAVGNLEHSIHRAARGDWTRDYAYDEASLIENGQLGSPRRENNRLSTTKVVLATGATTETYDYDAHGNMTSMPHLTLMRWDFKDQLSATSRQATNSSRPLANVSETTFYVYDRGGQRVRKVTERQNGTRKAERIYLGGFEVYREFKGDGTSLKLERETLHVMDDKRRIALVETRTSGDDGSPSQLIRYQHGNHLGSASLELDDRGSVISYEEYTPYGSTSYQALDKSIAAGAKRYRFTGKERDEETGFAYHGARYYAPWLGRWANCDPAGLVDGTNLFQFVRGNPSRYHDPTGNGAAEVLVQQAMRFVPVVLGGAAANDNAAIAVGVFAIVPPPVKLAIVGSVAVGGLLAINFAFTPTSPEPIANKTPAAAAGASPPQAPPPLPSGPPVPTPAPATPAPVPSPAPAAPAPVPSPAPAPAAPAPVPSPAPTPAAPAPVPSPAPTPAAPALVPPSSSPPSTLKPAELLPDPNSRLIPAHELVTERITVPKKGRGITPDTRRNLGTSSATKKDAAHTSTPHAFTAPGDSILVRPQERSINRAEGRAISEAGKARRQWNQANPHRPQLTVRP